MTAPPTAPTVRNLAEAALALQADPGADRVAGLWRTLAPDLISIIGVRGFDTLFLRCVRLARREHPWLRPDAGATPGNDLFTALEKSLAAQDAAQAAQASMTLFIIFSDILASLIGEALTKHLLRDAWGAKTSDDEKNSFNDD